MSMFRSAMLAVLLLGMSHLQAWADSKQRTVRIGYLTGGVLNARIPWLNAFRDGLKELGYEEGRNLVLEIRAADGRFERLPELIDQLMQTGPDVLLVSTASANVAVKKAALPVPVVMVAVGDPVGTGLVSNLARPGGNITGVTNASVGLTGKRLEMLKELVPEATQVAVIVNPDDAIAAPQMSEVSTAALRLGITLDPVVHVRSKADLEPAIRKAAESGAQAAMRMVDPLVAPLRAETVRLGLAYKLPIIYAFREDANAGGFASYGTSQSEGYRRAASFVHRILGGTPPGELPIEQPSRFELVINLGTARQLGLAINPDLLAHADEVIE